ncbi:MAG: YigZ family protein [Anaerolineales bacterium]|nr:YigZ family protein [Anaerolineales bacterium]
MPDTLIVPAHAVRRELVVARSRFIATLAPASSVEAAQACLARVRAEFADATHHVPAYLIGGGNSALAHCSDDGEPAGTAGRPALVVLRGSGLGDVAVVITRYFGGTLLGAGGLVRAYTEATQLAVQAAPRARQLLGQVLLLAAPYAWLERLRRLVSRHGGTIQDETFGADITLTLQFPATQTAGFQAELRDLSAGQLQAEHIENVVLRVPIAAP